MDLIEAKNLMLKGERISRPEWREGDGGYCRWWTIEDGCLMEYTLQVTRQEQDEIPINLALAKDFEMFTYELPEVPTPSG